MTDFAAGLPSRSASIRSTTVVLVGGRITLAEASEIDSRQRMNDATTDRVVRTALISAPEWWEVVSSVVLPTMRSHDDFALVVGHRALVRATVNGEARRSRLAGRLNGGTGLMSIERSGIDEPLPEGYAPLATLENSQGANMGGIGFRTVGENVRWRFVEGSDYYLRIVASRLRVPIAVDCSGVFLAGYCEPTDVGTLGVRFAGDVHPSAPRLVVLPDTQEIRSGLEDLLADRPTRLGNASNPGQETTHRYVPTPVDPLLAAVRSDCRVTGLLRAGRWDDASSLEAARVILLERFDLKVGLWDLALNPVLRSTLRRTPSDEQAHAAVVHVSSTLIAQRDQAAEKRRVRREAAKVATRSVLSRLYAVLANAGWKRERGRESLRLDLTEPLATWPGAAKWPLVMLRVELTKADLRVIAWQHLYNQLSLKEFVEARRVAFDALGPLPSGTGDKASVQLWGCNQGWASQDADWNRIAETLGEKAGRWKSLLGDFVGECRRVRDDRLRRARSSRG